jgi:peroxiredoxin
MTTPSWFTSRPSPLRRVASRGPGENALEEDARRALLLAGRDARQSRFLAILLLGACLCTALSTSVQADPPAAAPSPSADKPETAPPPPKPQLLAEGQVLNAVGGGVAGVEVVARRADDKGTEGEVIARAKTDGLGDYRLQATEPYTGPVVVRIEQPEYQPIVHRFECGPDSPPRFLADELVGALVLKGKVVESIHKKPLTGARVRLDALYRNWNAVTADDGAFEIQQVPPASGMLVVEADGYGREQLKIESLAAPGMVEVVLKPERIARLRIVDDQDRPIPGVTIEFYEQEKNDYRMLVTDAEGKCELRGLNFETVAMGARLTHRDHVSSLWFDRKLEFPLTAAASDHTLVLPRAGRVVGRVVDEATGRPLQGGRVLVGDVISDYAPVAYTDDDGRYTIEGAVPGKCRVTVHRTDYAPKTAEVEVTVAQSTTHDFKLTPGAAIKGTVKFEDGKPATGAMVETGDWLGGQTLGLRAMIGESGTFEFEHAPPEEIELVVSYRGGATANQKVRAGSGTIVELVLSAAAAEEDGRPVAKVKRGDPVPELKLIGLDGKPLRMEEYKGKVVLLHFWATWCPGCVAEIPAMVALSDKLAARKDVVIISLSLDGEKKLAEKMIADRKMKWLHAIGEAGGAMAAADSLGVYAIPTNFIIDGQGQIADQDIHGPALEARLIELATKGGKP